MDEQKKIEMFKATAAVNTPAGREAYRAFAASLTGPILKKAEELSYMRDLFTVEKLAPGAQPSYPISDEMESPVWILPAMGALAMDYVEFVTEEIIVPTFTIQVSKDWLIKYAREGRLSVVSDAQKMAAKGIAKYEEQAGWRVVIPACTTGFNGGGNLPPRPAPIYQMPAGDRAEGYFSKELINRMATGMKRTNRNLQLLWVSPEDVADIREYTETDVDPVTRREIFQMAGLGKIWNVQLQEIEALGLRGRFNINDKTSDFGPFVGASGNNKFNDYQITNGNILDTNGNLTRPGETQIYGFDMTETSLVMPVKMEYEAMEDITLLRKQRQGFFGFKEFGMACLDPRFLCMGVIDRYTPAA